MTIRMYGPVSLTGLQIASLNVDVAAAGILCINRSLYWDAYVSISSSKPTTVPGVATGGIGGLSTFPSDTNAWQMYIPPGNAFILPIPDQRTFGTTTAPYSIGPGTSGSGTIWYAAVPFYQNLPGTNPQLFGLAPTGFADTSYGQLVFFTWDVGDDAPDIVSSSLTSETTGQPRVVALPAGPAFGTAAITSPAVSTWTTVGNNAPIANFPFALTARGGGLNGFVVVPVYSYSVSVLFSAVTFQQEEILLRMVILDSASAIVSTVQTGFGWITSDGRFSRTILQTGGTTAVVASFANPIAIPMSVVAGAGSPYSVALQMEILNASAGGPWGASIDCTFDVAGFYPPEPGSPSGAGGMLSAIPYNTYNGFTY